MNTSESDESASSNESSSDDEAHNAARGGSGPGGGGNGASAAAHSGRTTTAASDNPNVQTLSSTTLTHADTVIKTQRLVAPSNNNIMSPAHSPSTKLEQWNLSQFAKPVVQNEVSQSSGNTPQQPSPLGGGGIVPIKNEPASLREEEHSQSGWKPDHHHITSSQPGVKQESTQDLMPFEIEKSPLKSPITNSDIVESDEIERVLAEAKDQYKLTPISSLSDSAEQAFIEKKTIEKKKQKRKKQRPLATSPVLSDSSDENTCDGSRGGSGNSRRSRSESTDKEKRQIRKQKKKKLLEESKPAAAAVKSKNSVASLSTSNSSNSNNVIGYSNNNSVVPQLTQSSPAKSGKAASQRPVPTIAAVPSVAAYTVAGGRRKSRDLRRSRSPSIDTSSSTSSSSNGEEEDSAADEVAKVKSKTTAAALPNGQKRRSSSSTSSGSSSSNDGETCLKG